MSDEQEARLDANAAASVSGSDPQSFGTFSSNSPKTLVRAVWLLSCGINGLIRVSASAAMATGPFERRMKRKG